MMEIPVKLENGKSLIKMEIDGKPHLDAIFILKEKFYKITHVANLGTEIEPHYEVNVKEIPGDKI